MKDREKASGDMVSVYIMGKEYRVPANLTIMKAMEYAGYKLVRGAGCRGGFCGACATAYRIQGDYRLKFGLACQTVVQEGMFLTLLPFFPGERAQYQLSELAPTYESLVKLYPQLLRCLGCGTCTKSCPQELDVRSYMADAMKGRIAQAADKSFDCLMCGLCAARCPAEEVQANIAILCRRLYGKYLAPGAKHLAQRVADIAQRKYAPELAQLKTMDEAHLRELYNSRDIEPE